MLNNKLLKNYVISLMEPIYKYFESLFKHEEDDMYEAIKSIKELNELYLKENKQNIFLYENVDYEQNLKYLLLELLNEMNK